METHKVIDRLKKRDKEAPSYLFDNYADSLNGIISRILSSEKVAEEVLHQTFFKIWENINQYDESKSTFFTWMSQIARKTAVEFKREKEDKNVENSEALKAEKQTDQSNKSNSSKIDKNAFIENLDEENRIIIDYIFLRGYSQSQTAVALQIPLDTVNTRLRFAILELRGLMKDDKDLFFGVISLFIFVISYLCL